MTKGSASALLFVLQKIKKYKKSVKKVLTNRAVMCYNIDNERRDNLQSKQRFERK